MQRVGYCGDALPGNVTVRCLAIKRKFWQPVIGLVLNQKWVWIVVSGTTSINSMMPRRESKVQGQLLGNFNLSPRESKEFHIGKGSSIFSEIRTTSVLKNDVICKRISRFFEVSIPNK